MTLLRNLFIILTAWMIGMAPAFSAEYKEGVHYTVLPAPQATAHPDKIEVLEAFSFGCPHCYHFEPQLKAWIAKKPADVYVDHIPAEFNRFFTLMARVYYAASVLGVEKSIHTALFDAIHRQRRDLRKLGAVADFMAEHGVDRDQFMKAAQSFAVETKLRRARALYPRYGVRGVPSMIVDGKYLVAADKNLPTEDMMKVVTFLVNKVRAEHKTAS